MTAIESLELLVLLFPHIEPNLRAIGRLGYDRVITWLWYWPSWYCSPFFSGWPVS